MAWKATSLPENNNKSYLKNFIESYVEAAIAASNRKEAIPVLVTVLDPVGGLTAIPIYGLPKTNPDRSSLLQSVGREIRRMVPNATYATIAFVARVAVVNPEKAALGQFSFEGSKEAICAWGCDPLSSDMHSAFVYTGRAGAQDGGPMAVDMSQLELHSHPGGHGAVETLLAAFWEGYNHAIL